MLTMFFHKCLTQQYKNILTQHLWRGFENIFRFLRVFTRFKPKRTLEDMEHLLRMRHLIEVRGLATELKNANGYVSALRHRTWAQARPHLK